MEVIINTKFKAGDPVWFICKNEISKGVINRVEISAQTDGLSSRGYKVREFFNKLLRVPSVDNEFKITITYSVDLLWYEDETYRSTPHIFKEWENKLFSTKEELVNSYK